MVYNKIEGAVCEASLIDVLLAVRDRVHLGHTLLTHPLAGSVKPGQTPYRSVVVSAGRGEQTDFESLALIEDALRVSRALTTAAGQRELSEKVLSDFQLIDYSLIAEIL